MSAPDTRPQGRSSASAGADRPKASAPRVRAVEALEIMLDESANGLIGRRQIAVVEQAGCELNGQLVEESNPLGDGPVGEAILTTSGLTPTISLPRRSMDASTRHRAEHQTRRRPRPLYVTGAPHRGHLNVFPGSRITSRTRSSWWEEGGFPTEAHARGV